jgi:hypothetical protein
MITNDLSDCDACSGKTFLRSKASLREGKLGAVVILMLISEK